MRISLGWLSQYISIPFSPEELADRLTMLGIEVEAIEYPDAKWKGLVVGQVLEVADHPNADRLHLTKVDVGASEPLRIVCGAPNVRAGLHVAVAKVGTDFGDGFVIKKAKIRGEHSEGMLCSERELGLSDNRDGIWELPVEFQVGTALADLLGKSDVCMEIGITPNRADCLSHLGIAREIRAMTAEDIRIPVVKVVDTPGELATRLNVSLPEPKLCPRYAAKLVQGVKVGPSPAWLRQRLESVGLRPINNVVDVTNFVLMELGHPLHAFDRASISGNRIVVRTAEGFATECVTLDGKVRKLPPSALLITDGQKPLAIAGIMGGESSEITDSTTDVLIESAYFNPSSIRKTSRLLGLSTDASYRFERGTDINVIPIALERAASLIAELGGGNVVDGTIDICPSPAPAPRIIFRPSKANALLGTNISTSVMRDICERLGIEVIHADEQEWELHVPSYRVDLVIEEDIIEEIARVFGYDNIPTSAAEPTALHTRRTSLNRTDFDRAMRNTLHALGVTECVTTPLVNAREAARFAAEPVELVNPLNAEKDRMRSSLIGNLLEVASRNERFGASGQRLFEIGSTFEYMSTEVGAKILERETLTILLSGEQVEKSPYVLQPIQSDFFLAKAFAEQVLSQLHWTRFEWTGLAQSIAWTAATEASQIVVDGLNICTIARVSDELRSAYDMRGIPYVVTFDYTALYALAVGQKDKPARVTALPKYPAVERDIAIVLSHEVSAATIVGEIQRAVPGSLLESYRIFDEFQSKEMKQNGERSLAIRLKFRAGDHTLEEHEIESAIQQILKRLESELHAQLRA